MAADEYSTGGGKLKFKGSKVSGGRVEKKKKKAGKKTDESGPSARPDEKEEKDQKQDQDQDHARESAESDEKSPLNEDEESGVSAAKTETQRKYEEVRRKRVCSLGLPGFLDVQR